MTSIETLTSSSASTDAVFASLRQKLCLEVSGSAILSELLWKLNRMQEAHQRPVEFKSRFEEFVARAAEHQAVVRPFYPHLVRFFAANREEDTEDVLIPRGDDPVLLKEIAQ